MTDGVPSSALASPPMPPPEIPARSRNARGAFTMLMRREWMQNRLGWGLLLGLPPALLLVAVLAISSFVGLRSKANVMIVSGDAVVGIPLDAAPAALLTMVFSAALPVLMLVITAIAVGLQLAGLARRDMDDRSLAFWRTLPVSDSAAVGATVVSHVLALPVAAWVIGLAMAQLVALLTIVLGQGFGAWWSQPWHLLVPAGLALLLRGLLGIVLAAVWLSPVIGLLMAASSWLKRWGAPLVVLLFFLGDNLFDRFLPQPVFAPATRWLFDRVSGSFYTNSVPLPLMQSASPADVPELALPILPATLLSDASAALADLARPGLLIALAVAALGLWLTVLRRRTA